MKKLECPAYACFGSLYRSFKGENFTCDKCGREYGKPLQLKDYDDYKSLFKDDLVVAVRKLLSRIENKGDHELEDSNEHNALKEYFNKNCLHEKVDKIKFEFSQFIK